MTHSDVIHAALQGAVDDGTFPGAVLAVRLRGRLVYEAAVGRLFVQPLGEPVTTETWYDLASLTKVLATTTALLLLVQRGEVALGDPIQKILPELVGRPCGSATIRQLLTHSSGLPGWRPYFERIAEAESTHPGLIGTAAARQAVLGYIGAEELIYEPTTRSLYSDLGFILLGLAVERVTRQPLDRWCQEQIFEPFHAEALSYLPRGSAVLDKPSSGPPRRIAATEVDAWRGRTLCGEVHDENAFALGGVAGHAGLFGTARSVLAIVQAWMDGYRGHGTWLDPKWVRVFTQRQQVTLGSSWALGWDTPSGSSSAGALFSSDSFGHLGYTGTSIWIDPIQELEVVLLSNRVHPTRRNESIRAFRPKIHDLVYQECVGR
ncbi:MAG: hypothetical protein NBKEAIPA_03036 [Nitrospirae bacterium]|nr:MAG: putative esterase, beta-lactamase family [Nitrospira sp. OLB3]MBV6471109.1 hypothetical protein [Nitrospirota bacterium]MCE7966033.1 serine hydrolase [Nitrospira sp. NTP2]MCK6493581.1 serine hydrolase [Nitrospira sp.]MEB2339013.1 serine hydrolase [Nitrospirales bacterium]